MQPTLLLNLGFEPVTIISWQRAVTLLVLGKADVVEVYDTVVRSVNSQLAMPSVVRLKRYVRRHSRGVRFSRENVYRRDGFACAYCGEKPGTRELTLDHVLPRAQGGALTWCNAVTACVRCNNRKGNRTPEQAAMPLRTRPTKPASLPGLVFDAGVHASWRGYV